ncbi:MAG TPA: 50S ribosomal protein L22 [Terriglobales bacterium]|nr:50S ribosomal protein L22 [Terriglobales bacterium]
MEFRAEARYIRVSPQKARLVLNAIKGQRAEDAITTLAFMKKGIAPTVGKLLRSAVENANYLSTEKGLDVELDNLFVKDAVANDGPRMKRIRPAPMGRAYRYQRRISHLIIVLGEKRAKEATATVVGEEEATPKKAAPKKRAPAKKAVAKKKTAAKKSTAKAKK